METRKTIFCLVEEMIHLIYCNQCLRENGNQVALLSKPSLQSMTTIHSSTRYALRKISHHRFRIIYMNPSSCDKMSLVY